MHRTMHANVMTHWAECVGCMLYWSAQLDWRIIELNPLFFFLSWLKKIDNFELSQGFSEYIL